MGKILKTSSTRHEATLNDAIKGFVETTLITPLHLLPSHLSSFPTEWPFPRGDIYHWIPVLNRFDDILSQFNGEYGLSKGPQTQPFGRLLLRKDDGDKSKQVEGQIPPTDDELDLLGLPADGDRVVVESILRFTAVLLDNAGNRSLYASSPHLGSLLNTTSLSLLKENLLLLLRLAKRYFASKQRFDRNNVIRERELLEHHYNVDLASIRKIASPFVKGPASSSEAATLAKGKEKTGSRRSSVATKSEETVSPADLVSIVKSSGDGDQQWPDWAHVTIAAYQSPQKDTAPADSPSHLDEPSSPSPAQRRPSSNPHQPARPSRLSQSDDSPNTPSAQNKNEGAADSTDRGAPIITISQETLCGSPATTILKAIMPLVQPEMCYELLNKIRVSQAMTAGTETRQDIVAIRILAIANLAYVDNEPQFQQDVTMPDAQEPRRLQLAYQLAELVHPPEKAESGTSKELQIIALWALEALTKQKSRQSDVYSALSANVNHGILFFLIRKMVNQLAVETTDFEDKLDEEWREALYSLLSALPGCSTRASEAMISAGLFNVLVEVLSLRTEKAERTHWKILQFLHSFLHVPAPRDVLQSLVNARGLDTMADLTSYTVSNSYKRAQAGNGMPKEYKTQMTDYQIPFHQQLALRWLFKFLNHSMTQTGTTLHRQLRNLIDSPKLLEALRQVLSHAAVYGSNVWASAVNILSNFIHNEPTSYAVIAEARLNDVFIEAVSTAVDTSIDGSRPGVLPVGEAMQVVPTAFGAICLNENGLKQFQDSKALESFFAIFQSPEHIKGMESEGNDTPTMLGGGFDELVRHHPALKTRVLDNVVDMVRKVVELCSKRASEDGVGAKLWYTAEDGKLHVAGGHRALRGNSHSSTKITRSPKKPDTNGDVDMTQSEASETDPEESNDRSIDQVVETEDVKDGPSITQYISVVARFLHGFFNNKSCCQAFIDLGGLESLLDLATLPSLPYNFEGGVGFGDEVFATLRCVLEEKPHLAVPATIRRVYQALEDLKPMLETTSDAAFFSPFISIEANTPGPHEDAVNGTMYAKALVNVRSLCTALSTTFQTQVFSNRSQNHIFYQVNLTDMYIHLVKVLGQLHQSCIWEGTLLQKQLPPGWEVQSPIPNISFGDPVADNIFHLTNHDRTDGPGALNQGQLTPPLGTSDPPSQAQNESSTVSEPDQSTARFKNTRILRHLLSRVTTSITPLFSSLGRTLLLRRVMDPYQKSNAYRVANQLGSSALEALQFERARNASAVQDRYSYWILTLTNLNHLIMGDSYERSTPQTLTLVLSAFKDQGGFAILETILHTFADQVQSLADLHENKFPKQEDLSLMRFAYSGCKLIFQFYSYVIDSRHVNDAIQTQAMTSRNSDKDKPDFFSPSQFLVEVRYAVIRPVMKIWESPLIERATTPYVKDLIEILRLELEGESEQNAFSRSDKISPRRKASVKQWVLKAVDIFNELRDEYGDDLAREAMYRCYEHKSTATEYCRYYSTNERAIRNPIPTDDLPPTTTLARRSESGTANGTVVDGQAAPTEPPRIETSSLVGDESDDEGLSRLALAQFGSRFRDAENTARDAARAASTAPAQENVVEAEQLPDVVTIDDLNEERAKLRADLIDRCLEVLGVHDDVTFELSDLITAATGSNDQNTIRRQGLDAFAVRQDIGSALVQALLSLQIEDVPKEEFRGQAKSINAYAHLLALVIQDKAFYEAIQEQLTDSFTALTDFVKLFDQSGTEPEDGAWIPNILLVLERLLSDDAQPRSVIFEPPGADDPIEDKSPLKVNEDKITIEFGAKLELFNALLKLLPRVGKKESLALSVTRIMVMLTRHRELATALGEKTNLQGLFTMVRQLGDFTNARLQSSFMILLRHIVEDEDTVRQIMRTEIVSFFRHQQRPMDTTGYTRTEHFLVIRNNEIFVEVSDETLKLSRYEPKHGPQTLALKRDPQDDIVHPSANTISQPDGATVSGEIGGTSSGTDTTATDKPVLQRTKTAELKMPVIEKPDGVIHFLISELLNYKDVEDPKDGGEPGNDSSKADVEMTNGDLPSTERTQGDEPRPQGKEAFNADKHPLFVYRCTLLQCLTELLSSYNRTKIEFINYKRRAEAQVTSTPSKPRSFVLNYLLSNLIPLGTISHEESIASKKRVQMSACAIAVINALCSKTDERGPNKPPHDPDAYEEEPELLFVRKFVLEHALRVFKEAQANSDPLDYKYSRLMGLALLFERMLTPPKTLGSSRSDHPRDLIGTHQEALAKIMYEKNYIAALTSAIADIDLNFPNARRAVKYILRPLRILTGTAVSLSMRSDIAIAPGEGDENEISSASSEVGIDDTREETPDLFRNSALGILDPRGEDDDMSESEDEDEDMGYDEFEDEMGYEEEPPEHDPDEVVSDEEEEMDNAMGPMENLSGDMIMDMEVVMEGEGEEEYDEDDEDGDDLDEEDENEEEEDEEEDEEDEEDIVEDEEMGADDDEWGTEEEDGEDYPGQDETEDDQAPAEINDIVRALRGESGADEALIDGLGEAHEFVAGDPRQIPVDDLVDLDEEEDPDDYDDDPYGYEEEMDDDEDLGPSDFAHHAWAGQPDPRIVTIHRHHGFPHRRDHFDLLTGMPGTDVAPRTGNVRSGNDGTNPLLQRQGHNSSRSSSRRRGETHMATALATGSPRIPSENPIAIISNLMNSLAHGGAPLPTRHFSVEINGLPMGTNHLVHLGRPGTTSIDHMLRDLEQLDRRNRTRLDRGQPNTPRDDPAQATRFDAMPTLARWKEEANILFGQNGAMEKAQRVVNELLRLLIPPAREAQKREAEKMEQLRKEREAAEKAKDEAEQKEREEREAREKKEREEQEAAEREAAEARAQVEEPTVDAIGASVASVDEDEHPMEGIETAQPTDTGSAEPAGPSQPVERTVITLRGRQVDITELGIDLEYLEALPEEVREEVILGQIAERRSQANRTGAAPTNLPTDFLDQLPPDIREELLAQEATERRQQEREEARRRAITSGSVSVAEEMNPADFFATLEPHLRNQILAEADDEILTHLDPGLAAEARALGAGRRILPDFPGLGRSRARESDRIVRHEEQAPRKFRPVVQLLDKPGVATLLRLMFIPQRETIKKNLDCILQDICNNRQNRAEVVSILLSILQDGSSDVHAVDRSFQHLSLRAKQPAGPKTPQTKRSSPEVGSPNSEMSPIMVVQQCLSALVYLTANNRSIVEFFLKEHETVPGAKSKAGRKSKGKEKDNKANKYPLNALLGLLDRKLVIESSPVMEQLASLLATITAPLLSLHKKKEDETKEDEKKEETPGQMAEATSSTAAQPVAPAEPTDVDMATSTVLEPPAAEPTTADNTDTRPSTAEASVPSEEKKDEPAEDKTKKPRFLESPPEVPEHNLRLVVNIVAARECSSKTFKDTMALITHLSAIPEAKEIFGRELILQAQELGHSILHDLEYLVTQITDAETGTDVQGMALARFSPASSDQAKLLRVMTALDWLFDPKPQGYTSSKPIDSMETGAKTEILMTLYQNETFAALWKKLSECLTAVRERGNMFNVATILMPLIEVLMVVCKNTTLKEAPLSKTLAVEFQASTPPPDRPEARMEDLFFNFTEEHRKILNDLVRHNPKLMSGSFSLLVKNSKVLEFDNKRNYFHRKLHTRGTEVRQAHSSLQLSVRRDQVFLDSFKSLYYKKADEFKYGRLNIRFSGEEGVDAGGVTREWFQVLAKQMFDPNYALFNPVASDRTTFHPNPHSAVNPEHLTFFKFIGRVIGKALYESRVLDCHFSRAMYKRMLGKPVSIKDMETLDLEYYKSVVWMLENDITDIITETFSVEDEPFGEKITIDLIPDGRNVQVTEENKQEYVRLVVEYKMIGAVKEQLDHFLTGFHDIVPAELISIFNEQELELLISGLPEIDVDDWKNNTDYHNYQAASPQIQWFWRAVRSFDKEERAKLLQFVTGTSKVPLNGFKELEGMNGFTRFNIHRDYGSKERLPSSHTCFNQLDLPEYESYEQLRKAVYTAFTAGSEYFGFA